MHFLAQTNDLGRVYHNTMINLSDGISPEFMLVRFTWAIFPLLRGFLDAGLPRHLRIQVMTEDGVSEEILQRKGDELRSLSSGSRSLGGASKKQKLGGTESADNNDPIISSLAFGKLLATNLQLFSKEQILKRQRP